MQQLLTTRHALPVGPAKRKAGDMWRTAAQQRQRAEIASEDGHSPNNTVFFGFLLAVQGLPKVPLVERQLLGFAVEQKVLPG